MNDGYCIKDRCSATLTRESKTTDGFKIGGIFTVECKGKEGKIKWTENFENIFVSEGIDYVLGVLAKNETRSDPLYIGLYTNSGGPQDSWTLSVGMTEFTDYTGDRKEFVDGAISGTYTISNSTNQATFSVTGSGTVYGAFMCTVDTGTTGTMLCAGDFASPKSLASSDTLKVTYTVGALDDGI